MRKFWVYSPEVDEAGVVVEAESPEKACDIAIESRLNVGHEVYAYEIGAHHYLGLGSKFKVNEN